MRLKHVGTVLLLGLAACARPADPELSASGGWARATGGSSVAAAYLTITNRGGADMLTGVRSSVGQAALHESALDNGVIRMRPIEPGQSLSIPSGGRLVLAPGGAHVMITGLERPLQAGDTFWLTLEFDRSRPQKVEILVRSAGESTGHGH